MTNAEKYKTPKERAKEYKKYCSSHGGCHKCGLNKYAGSVCRYAWLDLEYKEELKPCPFCGETKTTRIEKDNSGCFRVECQNLKCEMNPKTPWCDIVESAIGVWNRRAK